MELMKAKFLLENLLERIEVLEDGSKQLSGRLTDKEYEALKIAITLFDENTVTIPSSVPTPISAKADIHPLPEFEPAVVEALNEDNAPSEVDAADQDERPIEIDITVLSLDPAPSNVRLCLDFGTAMSKATLVKDLEDDDFEHIEVLKLGIPGDQENISEVMLVSSVFIDDSGLLWFGQNAVDEAKLLPEGSNRQQLDNIKRYLSEGHLNSKVAINFNPTGIDITYGDLILAYLMYLTWCVNHALEAHGKYPRNLWRRFAMPCLSDPEATEAENRLRKYLGEAQILADTFYKTLKNGVPLERFLDAAAQIRVGKYQYSFVTENISEPLGVAGSLLGPETKVDMLAMVVDVGAGTTDFSLYRIAVDPEAERKIAFEVENSSCCLTEAGNYLDQLLKNLIIRESGMAPNHPSRINVIWDLDRNIRDYKETLFNESGVFVHIKELNVDVEITLDDFLAIPQVQQFGQSLRNKMTDIMEYVDHSLSEWIVQNPLRKLVVVLTGGGASLPMVKELAQGSIHAHGFSVPLAPAKSFPAWLEQDHADLEDDYPRIAVALGGARKNLIKRGGVMTATAGNGHSRPTLGVDFTTGR
jgi:hypothetical protein